MAASNGPTGQSRRSFLRDSACFTLGGLSLPVFAGVAAGLRTRSNASESLTHSNILRIHQDLTPAQLAGYTEHTIELTAICDKLLKHLSENGEGPLPNGQGSVLGELDYMASWLLSVYLPVAIEMRTATDMPRVRGFTGALALYRGVSNLFDHSVGVISKLEGIDEAGSESSVRRFRLRQLGVQDEIRRSFGEQPNDQAIPSGDSNLDEFVQLVAYGMRSVQNLHIDIFRPPGSSKNPDPLKAVTVVPKESSADLSTMITLGELVHRQSEVTVEKFTALAGERGKPFVQRYRPEVIWSVDFSRALTSEQLFPKEVAVEWGKRATAQQNILLSL